MKKWTTLGETATSDGKKIQLRERDGRYVISLDGAELMSNREVESEKKLAELACDGLKDKPKVKVLIGGLGMGFTLRAALAATGPDAKVVVAELMPEIIKWNQNPAYPLAAEPLRDRRTELINADVVDVIARGEEEYDAIMLDVDNGPEGLTVDTNSRLYSNEGLATIYGALKRGGCLAVWSVAEDPRFVKVLAHNKFKPEVHQSRAHVTAGGARTIFIGRRSAR